MQLQHFQAILLVNLIKNVDFSNYVHDMKTLETKQIIVYSFKEDEEKKL